MERNIYKIGKELFITNDEEIKAGDWVYGLFNGGVVIKIKFDILKNSQDYKEYALKIILTTDQDLIKDGIQAIDDEFLDWFVKNPNCKFVGVRKEKYSERFDNDKSPIGNPETWGNRWILIIPKEEPKQETTLEEAAQKKYPIENTGNILERFGLNYVANQTFIEGAKWQQERSYSEEEVRLILRELSTDLYDIYPLGSLEEWFEQFKKK